MKTKDQSYQQFGDFQTPKELSDQVCELMTDLGVNPRSVIEPTCGIGQFLKSSLSKFDNVESVFGLEINQEYVDVAKESLSEYDVNIDIHQGDFFDYTWIESVNKLPEPLLVIGNPPWVTNSKQGSIGGNNLPTKSNKSQHKGISAITGKSNFDISESMILKLISVVSGKSATLAILCKSTVARKVFADVSKNKISVKCSIYEIDAFRHFQVCVDAVLMVIENVKTPSDEAEIYASLDRNDPKNVIGYKNERLIANIPEYKKYQSLLGLEIFRWRSGIKHDCSRVMELMTCDKGFKNGFGEIIDIDDNVVYPLMKSSDVTNGTYKNRYMIVPQLKVGEDTNILQFNAPKAWSYLSGYLAILDSRASSIYRNKPKFSIFGVGDYAFSPWKVAISGFYKSLLFSVIGPREGKPVVFDDTVYFISFENEEQAEFAARLLNSEPVNSLYKSMIFWDSKRPITSDILRQINLANAAEYLGEKAAFKRIFG